MKKALLTHILLAVSIIMLIVPVIPHHHHDDGRICLKDDLTPECCHHHHHDTDTHGHDHCCCDTGCITTHFFQDIPPYQEDTTVIDAEFPSCLMLDILCTLLPPIIEEPFRPDGVYLESLHGTSLRSAKTLRAPPCA